MKSQRKLRNYLLSGMQLGISLKYLGVALFSSVMTGAAVYISLWHVIEDYVPQAVVNALVKEFWLRMILFGIPLMGFSLAAFIILSHQIAGPIHKIMKQVDQLSRGEKFDDIRIRRSDILLRPFVKKLNEFVDIVRER